VPIRRNRESGWWWNALATENTWWRRELKEVAISLLSEAEELRIKVQETRWRAREQRERASCLRAAASRAAIGHS
jgi:hypothetical protein